MIDSGGKWSVDMSHESWLDTLHCVIIITQAYILTRPSYLCVGHTTIEMNEYDIKSIYLCKKDEILGWWSTGS